MESDCCSNMKGYLKIIVLMELEKAGSDGYDLMKKIKAITDKKPSPGSMYPLLSSLCSSGQIRMKSSGRKKIYSLTATGRKTIIDLKKEKESIVKTHLNMIERFESFGKSDRLKELKEMIAQANSNDHELILQDIDVIGKLRYCYLKAITSSGYKKKREQVRQIMKEAANKLAKLTEV